MHTELDLAAVRRTRRRIPMLAEARLATVHRELLRLMEGGGDL